MQESEIWCLKKGVKTGCNDAHSNSTQYLKSWWNKARSSVDPTRPFQLLHRAALHLQKARFQQRWQRIDWLMLGCFGLFVALHLASVILLAVKGSVPAHYYSQAAYLGTWCLITVSTSSFHSDAVTGLSPVPMKLDIPLNEILHFKALQDLSLFSSTSNFAFYTHKYCEQKMVSKVFMSALNAHYVIAESSNSYEQATAVSGGVDRLWKLLRLFVWEATILYGFTLFIHAWVADSEKLAVYMLAVNVVQLVVAVACCILTLMR